MNRRITITILVCLIGLWSVAASAKGKNDPPPPAVETNPKVPVPPPKLPPPAPAPEPPPAASPGSPVIEPPKLPPRTAPADPAGGHIDDRLRQIEDAGLLQELGEQQSGIGKVMPAGPGDDSGIGPSIGNWREEACKRASFRRAVGGLEICPGSDGVGLPSDGEFNTERPFKPAPTGVEEGPTAGSGVLRRDDRARDDSDVHEGGIDEPIHEGWTDEQGRRHNLWISADGWHVLHEVDNRDGTHYQRQESTVRGTTRITEHWNNARGEHHDRVTVCRGRRCRESQPGEEGRGAQAQKRAWFCARNPEAKGCKPTAPKDQIDPANPDGEGTAAGRPRAETPRVGRGAVSDPGSGDHILGTPSGGGSGPLDMKDPACQGPDCPGGPR